MDTLVWVWDKLHPETHVSHLDTPPNGPVGTHESPRRRQDFPALTDAHYTASQPKGCRRPRHQEPRPQTHSKEASLLTGEQDPPPQAPLAPHPGTLDSTHPSPHCHYLRQRPCSSRTATAVFHPPGSRQTPVVPENTFIHLQGIQANETTADHPH